MVRPGLRSTTRLVGAALMSAALAAPAADAPSYGPELEGFAYPYPLQRFELTTQGQPMRMAYMDVPPSGTTEAADRGRVAVLLHGKNFCGATWETTIRALSEAGWRVIVPDQIGFCASTKPARYQYSFQQLAFNTAALLQHLRVERAVFVGHSTGGMLAIRHALMFPERVERLVLVNPLGLEDGKALGVPAPSVDEWVRRERAQTAEKIRAYEQKTYYLGEWKPAFQRWVDMLAGLRGGPGREAVAWNSALVYDMIFTQPVVYELPLLKVPTLLLIGTADTTAVASENAPPEVRARLGRWDVLGKETAARIPGARLVEFVGHGHAPQIQDPERFDRTLVQELAR